jgi:long-chain acyl-CoA synthetase
MDKTIPETIFETAKNNPFKTALSYKKEGVYYCIKYSELENKIKKFSVILEKLEVKEGDKVAILSENRPEWAISDLAIMASGAISVPIHTVLSPKIIHYILEHCEAEILIVSNISLLNKTFIYPKEKRHLQKIIVLEKLSKEQKEHFKTKIIFWDDIFKDYKDLVFEKKQLNPDDTCSIIYTSGTTGLPKGVMLSHNNFLSNAKAVNETIPVKKSDVFLSFLPLSHILERLTGYYMPLIYGASIVYSGGIKQLADDLKEVRPTILICVPRVFEKFHDAIWDKINASSHAKKRFFLWCLKYRKGGFLHKIISVLVFKKIRNQLGGNIRLAISGGASLNDQIERFFLKLGIIILEGYGLTETSPVISANREKEMRIRTVGKVIPGVQVEINPENKEILVKGPNVMKGYYKNEEGTKNAFNKQGWFYTGDLGHLDKDGFLTVIGRKKEMVVTSGGKNIWPETIENLLNNDKYITSSMVLGHGRKFISALIYPDFEQVGLFLKENNLPNPSLNKLVDNPKIIELFKKRLDKVNEELADYEKIRKFQLISEDFSQERDELTPTLKLRRHIVEMYYKKETEEMYL